jgi:hypothetical protein
LTFEQRIWWSGAKVIRHANAITSLAGEKRATDRGAKPTPIEKEILRLDLRPEHFIPARALRCDMRRMSGGSVPKINPATMVTASRDLP